MSQQSTSPKGDAVRGYVKEAVAALGGLDLPGQQRLGVRQHRRRQGLDLEPRPIDMLAIVHCHAGGIAGAAMKSKAAWSTSRRSRRTIRRARQPPYGAIKAAVDPLHRRPRRRCTPRIRSG
jgi:hypothetical protein